VENVLGEIDQLLTRYDTIRMVNFDDDLFTMKRDWTLEFCDRYQAAYDVPFACNIRATHFDEELARRLYEAGCREVKLGLESGNEEIRKKVMGRHTPQRKIVEAFRMAEEAGLRVWSLNMIGVPTETWDTIMDTVRLNARIRSYIVRCAIFYPYKGTALHRYCAEHHLLDEGKREAFSSHLEGSVLKLDSVSQADLVRSKKMFRWMIDAESDIEVAPFYKMLVEYFRSLPDELWLNGEAGRMWAETDAAVDRLFKALRKEHYSSRKHLDINFSSKLNFEMP
jgi:radical SAM superfamily enzyme YgiQ (UPF0313 family)